jgi:shikimate kinase
MSCGKTTVGRQLAQALQRPFFDTDALLEASHGRSVAEIFADSGETQFRLHEYRLLEQLLPSMYPSVMACGGGLPCIPFAMTYLNRYSTSVYLHTPVDVLCARLQNETAQRPLLQGTDNLQAAVERLLEQRLPFYRQALWTVDTEGKSINDLCRILQRLANSTFSP